MPQIAFILICLKTIYSWFLVLIPKMLLISNLPEPFSASVAFLRISTDIGI
jgi:hypothetical protein